MGTLDSMQGTEPTADATGWPMANGLDAAIDAEASPLASSGRLNHGMLLLAGAVLVAVATLFVMRKTGATTVDGTLSAVELQIEKALAQIGGTASAGDVGMLMRDTDDVIAVFAYDPAEKQVELVDLARNPFVMHMELDESSEDPAASSSLEAQQRQMRVMKLRAELAEMKLQTVMDGRVPMAVISGKVVKPRDQLGSFRVALIERNRVILAAEGNTYLLQMKAPAVTDG